jgi:hypothetical protein
MRRVVEYRIIVRSTPTVRLDTLWTTDIIAQTMYALCAPATDLPQL